MAKKKRSKPRASRINAWISKQPAGLQPELRNARDELQGLLRTPHRKEFAWWSRAGSQVLVFFEGEKNRYGDNIIELLANHLQPGRKIKDKRLPNFLYEARDFARAYKEGPKRLANARNAKGKPLSISHAKALVSIEDTEQRHRFFDKCLDQCWSSHELCREIQNKFGRKRSGAGRKPEDLEPQSAGVALPNISVMAGNWLRNHAVWFVGPQAAFNGVKKKNCDEAILKEAELAMKGLEDVHRATGDGLKHLKSFVRELKKKLST